MERFFIFLASYRGSIILMLIYAIGLASATFVESKIGTEAAKMLIYYSPIFIFLQLLLVINFILILINSKYIAKRKWALIVIHISLIVILGGALTTFLFGKEGQVHIREGERSNTMVMHTSKGMKTEMLPFELELVDFRLNRYPGSQSPSSYESDLLVHVDDKVVEASIFMNNVLDMKGYRFFQASYDQDELGTVLSVNKDTAGRTITYLGYTLLLIGFLFMFFMPNSRFRKLGRDLKEVREASKIITLVLIFTIMPFKGIGQDSSITVSIEQNKINQIHAERFGALSIQFRGRVMPMNTFSSEILRKLHKETSIYDLNSDQFMLSVLATPQMWMHIPFIAVNDDYVSYHSYFDNQGNYRLLPQLQEIYHKPNNERTATDKDLIKLDEQINIFYMLISHSMPGIFPDPTDDAHSWLPPNGDSLQLFNNYLSEVNYALKSEEWEKADEALKTIARYQIENDRANLINTNKIKAELIYNQLNIFNSNKLGYFIFGGLLLIISFIQLFREQKLVRYICIFLITGIILTFIYHIIGMGLRWYVSGYAPWSNSYETMVYVAWATVLAGFVFGRKSTITLALATLFGGVILFVSSLNWMDPQINTLVPVLKSPWLMFHVAVIVAAYGFFGICFLIGITNLSSIAFAKKSTLLAYRIKELTIINNMSMLIGLALMTIGTFLGAVWANESWGRYWGWDPKETWALITVVIYSIVTHIHLVKNWNSSWLFNLLSVFAFSTVLMTYLGVNYFFSGMHSYGQMNSTASVLIYILIAFIAFALLGYISYARNKKGLVMKNKNEYL